MKRFPAFFASILITAAAGLGLWPMSYGASSSSIPCGTTPCAKVDPEDVDVTCDPVATSAAGGRDDVYGDCGAAMQQLQAAARRQDGTLWPRPPVVRRPRLAPRRRRTRAYSGAGGVDLQRVVVLRPAASVQQSVQTARPVVSVMRDDGPMRSPRWDLRPVPGRRDGNRRDGGNRRDDNRRDDNRRDGNRRDGNRRDGNSVDASVPRAVQLHGQPRTTSMKKMTKILLYAVSMFFEQIELTVYMSLYKIKLLYNTLIAPMMDDHHH